ncbi:MAG: hypothetical protein L7W43_14485, partial [Rubripirellula sp.]|nr:hypothetical protein [Rubripirellula sp.]
SCSTSPINSAPPPATNKGIAKLAITIRQQIPLNTGKTMSCFSALSTPQLCLASEYPVLNRWNMDHRWCFRIPGKEPRE